jgi:NAD(P)H-flavin reductase
MFARAALSDLAARHPQFRLTVAVRNGPADGSHGLRVGTIGDVMMEDRTDLAGCDLYMAGPSAMIDSLVAGTIRCGKIPADRVFFDRFS